MTVVNIVIGTMIAWVLVRDDFRGKRILEVVIDIPFALPTIVAGLVLLSLYGPSSPLGVDWANTPKAVFLAFLFVTLPFIVRTVAAGAAGAGAGGGGGGGVARREPVHHVPDDHPAQPRPGDHQRRRPVASPAAISEYGSLVLLSGNLPYSTEVASVRILSYVEGDKLTEAAAVASILLVVALAVIVALDIISRGWRAMADTAAYAKVVTVRQKSPVRWLLRLIVIGYLFLLVIWPVALVAKATFSRGSHRCWTRSASPT